MRPCFVFACFCGWRCVRAKLTQPDIGSTALSAFTACQALDVPGKRFPTIYLLLEDMLGCSYRRFYALALVLLLPRPFRGRAELLNGHLDSNQMSQDSALQRISLCDFGFGLWMGSMVSCCPLG